MRETKNNIHEINKYIIYNIYLFNEKNKDERIIIVKTILREIYFVDELVIDILLKINTLILEKINLLFLNKIAYINNYNISIFIEIYLKKSLIRRVISLKEISIIPLYLNITIIIYYLNLPNCKFLFKY